MSNTAEAGAVRGRQVLSLDGTWEIAFDPENRGRDGKWMRRGSFPTGAARSIVVPSCWELTEKDYEGVAFYRRTFRVPEEWSGQVVRLRFEAVNFLAEVWLNDSAIGFHEGGFTPFEFRVDDVLAFGTENTLILRVAGPILLQDRRVDGVGPLETPQWRGAITGGVWQSVHLVATGDTFLRDVFVEPRLADGQVTFHAETVRTATRTTEARVHILVRSASDPETTVAQSEETLTLPPGSHRHAWTLRIAAAVPWSPDRPHLYRADIALAAGGRALDFWNTRFGMREFTIRDRRFCLNADSIYIKAVFFEGLYPVGLAYPDSREMAIREIELAKQAGFNMIRPWRKPPPPLWLDLCDEMGMLTVGSIAVECMDFPVESARLPGWVANEVRESILRDRSRTCVVQWELFNELKRPVLKRMMHPMAMLARELDPTRLILDESGGWAYGANLYLPYRWEPTQFNDIHDYPGPHVNDEVYSKLLLAGSVTHEQMRAMGFGGRLPGRNVVPGLMTFFSELGYGSLPDLVENNRRFAASGNPLAPPTVYHRRLAEQHRKILEESGFDRIYGDLEAFCLEQQHQHGVANRRMIEAVRCNSHVAGYCIHALTDGDWIVGAGLLDLFRNPKGAVYEGTKAAGQPRILSIRVRPRNVYAQQGTVIDVTGVNEQAPVEGAVRVEVMAADGETVYRTASAACLGSGVTTLLSLRLDTEGFRGRYTVRACCVDEGGGTVADSAYDFDVFPPDALKAPPRRVALLDPGDALGPFLRSQGLVFDEFGPDTPKALPVLVSRTEARSPAERGRFEALAAFVRSGGTAIYLGGGGPRVEWGKAVPISSLLPVTGRQRIATATWNGVSHLVLDHPIFAGLPTNGIMGPVYENVWARNALLDVGGELVAGAIGYDWFPDLDSRKRHYYGPGDTWRGADLVIAPAGDGRCILSQLRLVENLCRDPVADRILLNLIRFAGGACPPTF
ncbi:MAG: hypothetical protein JXR77_11040 [Lentisphaeria bacterium]|nr:hypothetical protein [Lentisphaeria bacterium]